LSQLKRFDSNLKLTKNRNTYSPHHSAEREGREIRPDIDLERDRRENIRDIHGERTLAGRLDPLEQTRRLEQNPEVQEEKQKTGVGHLGGRSVLGLLRERAEGQSADLPERAQPLDDAGELAQQVQVHPHPGPHQLGHPAGVRPARAGEPKSLARVSVDLECVLAARLEALQDGLGEHAPLRGLDLQREGPLVPVQTDVAPVQRQ